LVFNHRAEDPVFELSKALSQLIHAPARRETLREAAWHTARNYTLPVIADRFITDFRSFLDSPAPISTPSTACLSR
jgi:hypothetical protein